MTTGRTRRRTARETVAIGDLGLKMQPRRPPGGCRRRLPSLAGDALGEGEPSRPAAFQPVLTIRARVEEAEVPAFTRRALGEIRSYINEHHLEVQGPPFSIRRALSGHCVDVEAGWPVRGAPGTTRIHSGVLPITRVRSRPTGA
jgi:hypothetical protein